MSRKPKVDSSKVVSVMDLIKTKRNQNKKKALTALNSKDLGFE